MPFYAGFDSLDYPQDLAADQDKSVMDWLRDTTNLSWCGYYLAPAPNRPSSGWSGKFSSLSSRWGILPIYVGQQDPHTATDTYNPSSILTTQQGNIDGNAAISLMLSEGFPEGSFVYLDWEYGAIDEQGPSGDYIKSWVSAVAADGRASPGVYCSHVVAQAIVRLIDSINPTPITRFWCWNVPTADSHPFTGDLANIPTIDPTGCGFGGAQSWQREQNAIVTFSDGSPIASLKTDFSTSSLGNPGAPSLAVAQLATTRGRMEIVLATGDRVIVGSDVNADALRRVIQVLTRG
jgi:hypothetical protein